MARYWSAVDSVAERPKTSFAGRYHAMGRDIRMSSNRRIALNIDVMYGRSLYALVNGLDVDDGAREITG